MDTGAQLLEENQVITQEQNSLFEKLKLNAELIAAIVCGIFILAGWILSLNGATGLSELLYILSFVIGGFAKAKEGRPVS